MLSGVLFHEDSKCLLEGGLKSRLPPKGGGFRHTNSFLGCGCTTSSILFIIPSPEFFIKFNLLRFPEEYLDQLLLL